MVRRLLSMRRDLSFQKKLLSEKLRCGPVCAVGLLLRFSEETFRRSLAMKHFLGEDDFYRIGRAVFFATAAIPAFVLVLYHRHFLRIQTVDDVARAELIAQRAAFHTEIFINQYGHRLPLGAGLSSRSNGSRSGSLSRVF